MLLSHLSVCPYTDLIHQIGPIFLYKVMYTRGLALLKDGLNLHWDSRILKYFIDFLCLDSQVREDSVVVYSDSKYLLFTNDE